ncbi:MAG: radical SAM protein [Planctomycetota bacterium]
MRIALIFPPFHHRKFSENLKVVDEEFITPPPIILAYVAAILERAGHKVTLIDANVFRLSKEETVRRALDFKPDMLGFRMDTYSFQETLEWIKYLKERTKLPVITGGINITNYPMESLSHPEIDYGIIGEAIESLPKFLRVLENKKDFSTVEGLVWRENGDVKVNPPKSNLADFDTYPFPARHLLPNEKYHSFVSQRKNFTIMLTSTGCPFNCKFCIISRLPYRERSAGNVLAEIERCYYDYHIREIDFFDGTFFINKKRTLEICEGIVRRGMKFEWTCRSRVDIITEEIVREASRAGCREINLGIESAMPEVLDGIKKQISVEQVRNAVKLCNKYGVRVLGFFMFGNPGETKASLLKTIEFMKELDLDFVQICRTIAKPQTDLNDLLVRETGRDYWREFVLGTVGEERLPAPWTELSQREIEKYLKLAYYGFYFRPKYIWRKIVQLKSFSEFMRYVRVALRMLFQYSYWDVPHPQIWFKGRLNEDKR